MDDLVQFLRDRLDEDERVARAAAQAERTNTWSALPDSYGGVLDGTGRRSLAVGYGGVMEPEIAAHIARHDPARALAEVDAKRRLLEKAADAERYSRTTWANAGSVGAASAYRATLRLLALPYVDHPDYREDWRP
ncbi:DUF6221 family protein [Streptomyces sp. NPDC003395]